jgi:branched-chain amino acid transport system permease protein
VKPPGWSVALVIGVVLAAAPYLGVDATWTRQLTLIAILALVVSGLNLSWGYAGELNLGQVAMYALGAYLAGYLAQQGVALWISIAGAGLAAALMGFVVALPGLRIGGWGLAMASFFLVILIPDTTNILEKYTGGFGGLSGIPGAALFGHPLDNKQYYVVVAVLTLAWFVFLRNLAVSRHGHAFQVLRESPTLAASLGIGVFRLKLTACVIGAIPAGIAGALFAYLDHFLAPELFDLNFTIAILAASVLGGSHSVYGALLGAAIMQLGPLRLTAFQQYALVAYGVFLVASGVFLSGGLIGLAGRLLSRRPSGTPLERSAERAVAERIPGAPLRVEALSKQFGGVRALNDVTLDAQPGAITGLIGANGSGKTTLLNVVSGFYVPTAGAVTLGGARIEGLSARQVAHRGVARTFQTPLVPRDLSTLDAVAIARYEREPVGLIASVLRLPRYRAVLRRDRERAMAMLQLLGIEELAHHSAAALPLGSRRLVEVARALVTQPAVLLLDEPASGLDESEVAKLAQAVRTVRDAGATVVLVEHNFRLVCEVSDRIYVLNLGNLIASGSAEDILADQEVARSYLGQLAETPQEAAA